MEITKNILETSLVTLIDRCKKRRYYKGSKVTEFTDRIENISVVDIIKQNGFYHRECYKTFSNLNEVKRTEKRFNSLNNDKQSAQTMLDRKVGRPSFKQGNQLEYKKLKKKTLWPLFKDGVQLPQDYSHFKEAVYFLPFSSQKILVLILPTSEG